NPVRSTPQVLEEGQVLYTRMCSPCHGDGGAGDGLVAPKFKGVANLNSGAIKAKPVGHIYQVITKGKGRMMPHNTQVNPEERWKIAMYVKQTLHGEEAPKESIDRSGMPANNNASADVNSNESANPVKN